MDITHRILFIIIIFVIFVVVLVTWLWYRNPHYLITWWNRRIKNECDQQDINPFNGIPSLHDAWNCNNKTATEFHRLLSLYHDDVLAEVMEVINQHDQIHTDNNDFLSSFKFTWTNSLNDATIYNESSIPKTWLNNENKWQPIWIKFMGEWAGSAEKLPTLKRIVSLFSDINIIHVSVFYPGTTLIDHRGPSRAVYRYHYGLKIPDGDIGLKIAGFDVKWKEKEGYIWDDTLPHSVWNHTSEPRIVIFADVFRELSPLNSLGSKLIYTLLRRAGHSPQIKTYLQ